MRLQISKEERIGECLQKQLMGSFCISAEEYFTQKSELNHYVHRSTMQLLLISVSELTRLELMPQCFRETV